MKYLFLKSDNEQYWIEVADNGYASRQLYIDTNNKMHVSCLEDCLAEGIIDEDDIDGTIEPITKHEFDSRWVIATAEERRIWDINKKQFSLNDIVECKVKYAYPQGWIVAIETQLGVCECRSKLHPNQSISGKIIGYDETNMWLVVSEVPNSC